MSFFRGVTSLLYPGAVFRIFPRAPSRIMLLGIGGCSTEGKDYGMTPRETGVRDLPEKFEICASKTVFPCFF